MTFFLVTSNAKVNLPEDLQLFTRFQGEQATRRWWLAQQATHTRASGRRRPADGPGMKGKKRRRTEPDDAPGGVACDTYQRALRFVRSLPLASRFVDWERHALCYCATCHDARGDNPQYERGDAKPCLSCAGTQQAQRCARECRGYGLPKGWCRFALAAGGRQAEALDIWDR